MSATVQVDEWVATVSGGEWTVIEAPGYSDEHRATLARAFKALVSYTEDDAPLYDPDPDASLAYRLASMMDGTVLHVDPPAADPTDPAQQVDY